MLRLERISRSFGATRAVDEVSLSVEPGVVTALIGENGAGKTTLMRIAAGELSPDSGRVETDGHVELVHQHFMLVADFTIAENIALAIGRPRWIGSPRAFANSASGLIAGSGIELGDVNRRVSDLSVGEKSKLELVKAILRSPVTLILDEPTSVLTPLETGQLFEVMRRLTAAGTAVVLISHKLPEVLEVAGRIVVMRAGRVVLDEPRGIADVSRLTAAMVDQRALS
ncbi:MAG: ATP-binding cassette domain-containing protein, partial [Thermoanaerobaculia bacterium]